MTKRIPQAVFSCHLLNKGDGFRVQLRTPTAVARFEFPEEPKTLAMPTEEGVGLEDEESLFPVLDVAGEEDEPEAIGLRNGGLFDLAVEDDKLLTEQRILGDEVGFGACKICGRAENDRMAGRLGEMQKGVFQERNKTNDQLKRPLKKGEPGVGLQDNCQKLSDDCIQRSNRGKSWTDGVFSQHRWMRQKMILAFGNTPYDGIHYGVGVCSIEPLV